MIFIFIYFPLSSAFFRIPNMYSSLVREIARGGLLTSVIGEKRGLIMCFWLFLGCAKKKQNKWRGSFRLIV